MIDARRRVLAFQGSVVFMLLLFSRSKSDLYPFLFAVAIAPANENIHVSDIGRKDFVPHGGSTLSSRVQWEDQNKTRLQSCESTEIILTTQYDVEATAVPSEDQLDINESVPGANEQVRLYIDHRYHRYK
jgi:hypothetical protein